MPRFERPSESGKRARFWEVDVDGVTVITRYGSLGTDGKAGKTKTFDSPEAAQNDADKRIREKLKDGYIELTTHGEPWPTDPELEAAIIAEPYSVEPYLVYADWLQAHDNPRGELISIQAAMLEDAHNRTLDRRQQALYKEHFCLGLPPKLEQLLRRRRSKTKSHLGYCEAQWRLGFIHAARVAHASPNPPIALREAVRGLITHPSGRFLAELDLGAMVAEYYDYGPTLEIVGMFGPLSLRRLHVGVFAPEHTELGFCTIGDLEPLNRLVHLRDVRLRGRETPLELDLPQLSTLELEVLELSPSLDALADMSRFPELRALRLPRAKDTSNLLARLLEIASARLETITSVSLAGGDLQNEDIDVIRTLIEKGITKLDLSSNRFTDEGVAALAALDANIDCSDQRPPAAGGGPDISDELVQRLAPDAKSVTAARKFATADAWGSIGWDSAAPGLWGRCVGSQGEYWVWVDLASYTCGCTCPSRKYPCKHALGLLLMAANREPIPVLAAPDGHSEVALASHGSYYESVYE